MEPYGHPWARFASERLGRFMQSYYEQQGVQFALNDEVVSIAHTRNRRAGGGGRA